MRFLFILVFVFSSSFVLAEDETVELTTYYPAPYGEYDTLKANSIGVGSASSVPNVDGMINFKPVTSLPDASVYTPSEGDLYYDDTDNVFKYRKTDTTSSSWVSFGGSETILSALTAAGPGTKASPTFYTTGTNNAEVSLNLPDGTWLIFVYFEALPTADNGGPGDVFFFRWALRAGITEILGDATTIRFHGGPPATPFVFWEDYSVGGGAPSFKSYSASTAYVVSDGPQTIQLTFSPTTTGTVHPVFVRRARITALKIA